MIPIAINNLRDHKTDKIADKKTLAVRLGVSFAQWEIVFLSLVPFGVGMIWWFFGLTWAAFLPLLMMPLAFQFSRKIIFLPKQGASGSSYQQFLACGVGLGLGFGLLLSLGLWLS
jgi:1,4-dihydroxy-2-naphthoate octaprenyltransferase